MRTKGDHRPVSGAQTTNVASRPRAIAKEVLNIDERMRVFERLPSKQQNVFLSKKLNALLSHAKRYSPFWNERLKNWNPAAAEPSDLLGEVPILSREDIQTYHDQIIARFPGREKYRFQSVSTSGSTGLPVRVQHLTGMFQPPQLASHLLEARWHKLDPMKAVGVLLSKVKDNDHFKTGEPFSWYGPTAEGFSCCIKNKGYDEIYDICARRRPSYLFSGATILAELARYALNAGRRDLQIESALSFASGVTKETRGYLREGLGAKVIDRYSCEEAGIIARQCPRHDHLHVLSTMVHVEIVDSNARPCPVGVPGRVLVTSLLSYGMPLIRYEIGDIAAWAEPCDCGITLPVIGELLGRTRHVITHPNGKKNNVRIYARDFEDVADLLEYRFVFHQGKELVAYLKVRNPTPHTEAVVTQRLQQAVGYAYPVKVIFVEEISWGDSWKRDYFSVSDSPPPARPINQDA